jgi:uncharacterized protein (DUF4415 family)
MTKRARKIPTISDAEEARIQAMIAADPDDEEVSDEVLRHPMTFAEAHPGLAETIKRARGRPRGAQEPKEAVTIRLPRAVLDRYRAKGDDWRARIAKAVEKAKP